MQELMYNMQTSYETYQSIGKVILLLTVLLGICMIKSTKRIRIVIFYIIISSLVVLNPFFLTKQIELLGEERLYRLGMIMLVPILSSYILTILYQKVVNKSHRKITFIGIMALIVFSGKFVYTSEYFYQASNEEKVYNLAAELGNCVTSLKEKPIVAISEIQGVFIRQYNANIRLICAPEKTENWIEPEDEKIWNMRAMLSDPNPDMQSVTQLAEELNCDYVILMDHQTKEDSPTKYGFVYVDTFEHFQVFERMIGME